MSDGALAAIITGVLALAAAVGAAAIAYAARGKTTKTDVEESLRETLQLYIDRVEALEKKVDGQRQRVDALETEVDTWKDKARASEARALAAEARAGAAEARAAAADVRVLTLVAEVNSLKLGLVKVERVQKEACGG